MTGSLPAAAHASQVASAPQWRTLPNTALSGNMLFVSNQTTGPVGAYNAATGTAMNANFITMPIPYRLTVSGTNLFVAKCCNGVDNGVGKYNATKGAAISPVFLSLFDPVGVAVSGNILFVSDFGGSVAGAGKVGEYDATTGTAINANFITGLNGPEGIALSGNILFVASTGLNVAGAGKVGIYDATTGAAINANFVTGLTNAWSIAISQSAAAVPEPSTWSMIAVGCVALLGIMRQTERRTI